MYVLPNLLITPLIDKIWNQIGKLQKNNSNSSLKWVPANSRIKGNEAVD